MCFYMIKEIVKKGFLLVMWIRDFTEDLSDDWVSRTVI